MTAQARTVAFFAVPALLLLAMLALEPMAQAPAYHAFADARALGGIPSFANVATNVALLAAALYGLRHALPERLPGWTLCFAGIAMTALGSAYYHLAPDDARLFWDRLPMALAFAGVLGALVAEHVGERAGRTVLLPLVVVCAGSVLYWRHTGDLRLYAWAQAMTVLAVPLALWLFPARFSHRAYYLYALALYGLAKLAEIGDAALYRWTAELLSGHSAKHLLAAAAIGCLAEMLRRRGGWRAAARFPAPDRAGR